MDAYTEKVISSGFEEVKGYIDRSLDDVFKRLDGLEASQPKGLGDRIFALEHRHPEKGEPGRDGVDGKDGALGLDGAPGKDGEPGLAGKDGEAGLPGANGLDGAPGLSGADGKDGLTGRNGIDGKDGAPGLDGQKGIDGINGKDGIGLASALIDRDGELVVTMTDGRTMKLGRVNGHDGTPGKDGLDGLGFDDFEVLYDDGREFKFAGGQGERRKEWGPFKIPAMIYRGVFKEGRPGGYQWGDTVTSGGSAWHAQRDTTEKPGDGCNDWVLAVKEGRKGKDGMPGKPGDPGAPGRPGLDGYSRQ